MTDKTPAFIPPHEQLRNAVDNISPEMPLEVLLAFEDQVSFFKQFMKELSNTLKDRLYEWIEANGEINLPEMNKRYYNAQETKTKCRDKKALIEALLDATKGDIEALAELLSSDPFKQGACKIPLGDKWDDHFEVVLVNKGKTGKPKPPTTIKVDTTFLPKKGE